MKLTLILSALLIIGCSKRPMISQNNGCAFCCELSDRYTIDSVYLRTDTAWQQQEVCGRWLDSIKAQREQWLRWPIETCPPPVPSMPLFRMECRRYVVGRVLTYPKQFK